jgi:DNA-directed RNA polymerase specialized sigma24 family protein
VLGIARNRSIDQLRRRRPEVASIDGLGDVAGEDRANSDLTT